MNIEKELKSIDFPIENGKVTLVPTLKKENWGTCWGLSYPAPNSKALRNEAISHIFDAPFKVDDIMDNYGILKFCRDGKYGLLNLNKSGTSDFILYSDYDSIDSYGENTFWFGKNKKYALLKIDYPIQHRWKENNFKTEFKYDNAHLTFIDGLSNVWINYGKNHGLIDRNGIEIILPKYENEIIFKEQLARVKISDRWGFIDNVGQIKIPCIFRRAGDFNEGLAFVSKKNISDSKIFGIISNKTEKELFGYIDKLGNVIISFKYDEAESFEDGRAKVKLGDKTGYIDIKGNEYW